MGSEITYVWTREGWVYVAVILDLFPTRVIGLTIRNRIKQDLELRAPNTAVALRRPPTDCIHHTDRGSRYGAYGCQQNLRNNALTVSMNGRGNCYDKSAVASVFKSRKAELVRRRNWQTRREVEVAIFEYINGFYNPHRKHSALGWKSPVAFAQRATIHEHPIGRKTVQVQPAPLARARSRFCASSAGWNSLHRPRPVRRAGCHGLHRAGTPRGLCVPVLRPLR